MAENKTISSGETTDSILIEEQPKDFRSLWLQFKSSPNRLAWTSLGIYGVSMFLVLPYVLFAKHVGLFAFGTGLLALIAMYFGFLSLSKHSFESKSKFRSFVTFLVMVTALGLGFRLMNWDKHVLVDYHERTEDFPYPLVTNELASPLIGWADSFTILVKYEDLKFKGPDFDSLAAKARSGSKEYYKGSLEEFKPFTIYYGSDAEGRIGDIKGKRIVNGWFGSTSTDFVIELEK